MFFGSELWKPLSCFIMKLSIKFSFPVVTKLNQKQNKIVIAKFSSLFVFTFYEQILSYGCETKTILTKVCFWCRMGGSKTFGGLRTWPVQMQTNTRNNNFVIDFSFSSVFTFYEQILSYGCERKKTLRTYLFDVKWEVLKAFGGVKKLGCTDADQFKEQ